MKTSKISLIVILSVLLSGCLFSCDDDDNNDVEQTIPDFLQKPPVGSTFESQYFSITFESADAISYRIKQPTTPFANDSLLYGKLKYWYTNGVINADCKDERDYIDYLDGHFTKPDILETNYGYHIGDSANFGHFGHHLLRVEKK